MDSKECIYNSKTNRCVLVNGSIGKKIIKDLNNSEIEFLQNKCYKKINCAVKPPEKKNATEDKGKKGGAKKKPTYKFPTPLSKDSSIDSIPKSKTKSKKKKNIPISRPPSPSISLTEEKIQEMKVDPDDCINRSKIPLLSHQKRVIRFLQNNRGIIAVHTVGSGKTLLSVAASQCFLDQYPSSKIIFISPLTLIDNFKRGMEYYGLDRNDPRYKFYSFESFLRESFVNFVCRNNFLIIDEAHILRTEALKEDTGMKIKKILQCSKTALKVLCLTATPIVNKSYDLENLISLVKGKTPMKESDWNQLMTNKRELKKYMSNCFDYYQNKPLKFPEKIVNEVFLTMNKQFYEEYKNIESQNSNLLNKYKILGNPYRFLQGLRTGLLKITDSAKINWTIEHAEEWINKKEKTVIFTNFVESGVKPLGALLEQIGCKKWDGESKLISNVPRYGVISGSVATKKRKNIIEKFNKDKLDILILSSAGGVGIDLRGVRNMVVLDVPWNKANLDQAIGRAVRYESHEYLPPNQRNVNVWILYNKKPVKSEVKSADLLLRDIIKSKEKLENEMLELIQQVSIQ